MLYLGPSAQQDNTTLYWIIQLKDPLSVTFLIEEGRVQQVTTLHVVLRKQTGFYVFFNKRTLIKLLNIFFQCYRSLLTYLQASSLHFIGVLYLPHDSVDEKYLIVKYLLSVTQP